MGSTSSTIVVRLARPANRPIQLWYRCPVTSRQIRRSSGTSNLAEANKQRELWEAELRLGIQTTSDNKPAHRGMSWSDFRNEYTTVKLATLRAGTCIHAESRLDIAERIVKPKLLSDMLDAGTLHRLQTALLGGAESKYNPPRPRSSATVRGYMRAILAALRWAKKQTWVDSVPDIDEVEADDKDDMKGRPLVLEEVERMLTVTPRVVGEAAAESWKQMIEAVVRSGLRLSELLSISWDRPQTIQPIWRKGRLPVLWFPGYLQKNGKSQEIPLCPWFEEQLLQTPEDERHGWVFNPVSLMAKVGRAYTGDRLQPRRVGQVVSDIGKRAGVIVDEGNPRTGSSAKYASCHDLRRTFATRLYESDLPPELIRKLMRHSDIRTTERFYMRSNIQLDAGKIRDILNQPKRSTHSAHTEPAKTS